ncbi:MAG: hypothetical protein HQ568_07290 [Calditrichaeota bacterium]|nr:hypothetical protein [Calditrichota bacterium]
MDNINVSTEEHLNKAIYTSEYEANILIGSYKELWNYYICQINILSGYRSLYMKVFLIPVPILTSLAVYFSKSGQANVNEYMLAGILSLLIILSYFIGFSLFSNNYRELGNLVNYQKSLSEHRFQLQSIVFPDNANSALTSIDRLRAHSRHAEEISRDDKKSFYSSIHFSLGTIFIYGNSFIIGIGFLSLLMILANKLSDDVCILIFIILVSLIEGTLNYLIMRKMSYKFHKEYIGISHE